MTSILEFCEGLPEAQFQAGDTLLAEGETSGKLFILIDGQVEILKRGYMVNVVSQPGAIFGEISVLLGMPHMATVRATEAARLYCVEADAGFLQERSEITYHLSKMLAQRLHGVTSYLVDLKRQFEGAENHLEMVDEVLETLVNEQVEEFSPGSDRDPDIKL